MTDLSDYRPNVGVVLFHPDGRVWLGRRVGTPAPHNWQFPQGAWTTGSRWRPPRDANSRKRQV